MKKIFILLIGFLATFSSFARDYTPTEFEDILKENRILKSENAEYAQLLSEAIAARKELVQLKSILKKSGLTIDKRTASLRLLDENLFMSTCNVVIFSQDEFNALNTGNNSNMNQPQKRHLSEEDATMERDFRKASKGDFSDKSKDFWNSVIY